MWIIIFAIVPLALRAVVVKSAKPVQCAGGCGTWVEEEDEYCIKCKSQYE